MIMANAGLGDDVSLVLGGTGKTCRRLADLLRQAGHGVRIGSRNAEARFDWENRDTWRPTLQGMRAAYVAYQPDLAAPGALEIVDVFFRQAVDSGVEKLVLLSGRGEVEAEQAEKKGFAGHRSGLDNPAVQLVLPELQLGRLPRCHFGGRSRFAIDPGRRALCRCR
jgi:hypothetical protein